MIDLDIVKFTTQFGDTPLCFYDTIATILKYEKFMFHELIFANSLDIEFNCSYHGPNNDVNFQYLHERDFIKTLGLDISDLKLLSNENVHEVKKSLLKQRPVMFRMDYYYIPWDRAYKISHSNTKGHLFLVVGIKNNRRFFCVDPYLQKKDLVLELDINNLLTNVYFNTYETNKIIKSNDIYVLLDIIDKGLENMACSYENKRGIYKANYIMDYFRKYLLKEIFNQNKNVWDLPIHFLVSSLSVAHMRLHLCLDALQTKFNIDSYSDLSKRALKIAEGWFSVRNFITKAYIIKAYNYKNKIIQYIKKIINEEDDFINYIIDFIKYKADNTSNSLGKINDDDQNSYDCEYKVINIESYVNNNAFSHRSDTYVKSNFDGSGNFFVIDDNIFKKEIYFNKAPFILSYIDDNFNDNIACKGQIIQIAKDNYNKLFVAGCCDIGQSVDYIKLIYDDNTEEEKEIHFYNCFQHGYPLLNYDNVIEKYKRGYLEDDKLYYDNIDANLYCIAIDVNYKNKLTSIKLPYCLNMYLFALTLSKIWE